MVTLLPLKIKSDFDSDAEFIAYMKKRRHQIANIQYRLNKGKSVIVNTCPN